MNHISKIVIAAALSAICVVGQSDQPVKWSEQDLSFLRSKYLKDLERSPLVRAAPLVTDPGRALPTLLRLFPAETISAERRKAMENAKRHMSFSFHVPVSELPDSQIQYVGKASITTYDTLKEAEDEYVTRLATLQVQMKVGTFTGQPLGEAAAYYRAGDDHATIYFLRKNVIVIVQYHCPIEVPNRRDRDTRRIRTSLPDPNIGEKCEALAREIDDVFAAN